MSGHHQATKRTKTWVLLVVAAVGLAAGPAVAEPWGCRVARVIDGDTFVCAHGPHVRLWGVSAPERDAPGGPAATAALRSILLRPAVTLACETRGVSYHRLVARCTLPDGSDLGAALLATGTACVDRWFAGPAYPDRPRCGP